MIDCRLFLQHVLIFFKYVNFKRVILDFFSIFRLSSGINGRKKTLCILEKQKELMQSEKRQTPHDDDRSQC